MKISKFWIVTNPQPQSELGDICFETDAKGFAMQLNGGLDEAEIHAIYTGREEAEREAKRILVAFKKYQGAVHAGDQG